MVTHLRRALARVVLVGGALLPALALVIDDGAKRWPH